MVKEESEYSVHVLNLPVGAVDWTGKLIAQVLVAYAGAKHCR
jgi:hypothetical protein